MAGIFHAASERGGSGEHGGRRTGTFWLSPMTVGKELRRHDVKRVMALLAGEPAKPVSTREGKALIDGSHDVSSFLFADQTTPIAISIDKV
jgi:hypothetical protein